MRLWSVHPEYLDSRGLIAVWREALLAQAVLRGRTRGYRHHPQLTRFRGERLPLAAIAEYLRGIHAESRVRGYAFMSGRISRSRGADPVAVTEGQLACEWAHLLAKLGQRDRRRRDELQHVALPRPHPLFIVVPGPAAPWERAPTSLAITGRRRPRSSAGARARIPARR